MAGNGTTGVFERIKDSGVWWIRWTDHHGKRHLEKVGRRGDAVTLIGKRRAESHLQKKLPEKFRGLTTFGQLADDAIRHSREANGERSTAELELKYKIIRPAFGDRSAVSMTPQEITAWLLDQGDKREWSAGTRNRYAAAFSLAFRVAVDNGKVETNPCRKIKRKKESQGRTRFLTANEEASLREAILQRCPHNLPAFTVSLHTGLRASEQWRLVWADIDFGQRILTARATKNGDPERHIPLNELAFSALKEQADGYPKKPRQHDPVFLNSDGGRVKTHRDWFNPAVEESGVEGYSWHVNRHTFASRLVMAGVNLKAVHTLMGHKTIAMTMRYSHLAPDHLTAAVAALVPAQAPSEASVSTSDVATQSVTGSKTYRKVTHKAS